jgi:Ni2+-binding GTPase involved in maturation of urease and hydrogenase
MKLAIIAGTPGAGKTSILLHTITYLSQSGVMPAVIKVDCLFTDDDARFERLGVPVRVALSRDMCPDHFAIYNTDEMLSWAREQSADILLNETAGLCLRCAPYVDQCLAVCVIDVTAGPNTPIKVGPLLTTADVVVATKGDIVSQAEREVFRERIMEANPKCLIIEANGLTGQGASELGSAMLHAPEISDVDDGGDRGDREGAAMRLRHNAPLAVCTLCTGEVRVAKRHHTGVLRHIDGFMEYKGE